MAKNTTDAIFGKLTYDAKYKSGYIAGFVDPRFRDWGTLIDQTFGDGPDASARQREDYDGPLDGDSLRKAGRFRLVVPNDPPTSEQSAAWRAFVDGGEGLAESIAQRLFEIYREQYPNRLYWWKKIYTDSPNKFLPDIKSPRDMRSIVRPDEFTIHRDPSGKGVSLGIEFGNIWADRALDVRIRDGQITSIQSKEGGPHLSRSDRRLDKLPFGPMQYEVDAWVGTFHSDHLNGFYGVSAERHRFATEPAPYDDKIRKMPPWDVVTGDYELRVIDYNDEGTSEAQAKAYHAFHANPEKVAGQVLDSILKWYRKIRPGWVANMNGSQEEIAASMPDINTTEELLEIIQLQTVTVHREPDEDTSAAIGIVFAWEDEHGIGVRWRDGKIEDTGDANSAGDN